MRFAVVATVVVAVCAHCSFAAPPTKADFDPRAALERAIMSISEAERLKVIARVRETRVPREDGLDHPVTGSVHERDLSLTMQRPSRFIWEYRDKANARRGIFENGRMFFEANDRKTEEPTQVTTIDDALADRSAVIGAGEQVKWLFRSDCWDSYLRHAHDIRFVGFMRELSASRTSALARVALGTFDGARWEFWIEAEAPYAIARARLTRDTVAGFTTLDKFENGERPASISVVHTIELIFDEIDTTAEITDDMFAHEPGQPREFPPGFMDGRVKMIGQAAPRVIGAKQDGTAVSCDDFKDRILLVGAILKGEPLSSDRRRGMDHVARVLEANPQFDATLVLILFEPSMAEAIAKQYPRAILLVEHNAEWDDAFMNANLAIVGRDGVMVSQHNTGWSLEAGSVERVLKEQSK